MKKNSGGILIIVVIAVLLIAASFGQMFLVFKVTSSQTKQSGADRLEVIGGELEDTINDAKLQTMQFALELQDRVGGDRESCRSFIREKKQQMKEKTDSVCFNVYMATEGWFYIPDFDKPDDYVAEKRTWYTGAVKNQGEPYVTDPYVDAMTGNICYTVSVLLGDGKTVASLDYTMDSIREHIRQMNEKGEQQAVIVTDEGIIAGCTDEELVGRNLIQSLPDYAGIFSLVKTGSGTVSIDQRGNSLFAARSGFGWYLIVSENKWSLYKTSIIEMIIMLGVFLLIFGIMLALYIITARRAKAAQALLETNQEFLANITADLREPVNRINAGASVENIQNSADYELEFAGIREAGASLSGMLSRLRSYNELVKSKDKRLEELKKRKESNVKLSRHFRSIILSALLIVLVMCTYITVTASLKSGNSKMQNAVTNYENQVSGWIKTQKSILDMFCSNISTNPGIINDYDAAVEYLDRITKQYPEISVSYIANPEWEEQVIMNNGWKPLREAFRVEERSWYKELIASDSNWIISSPYFDGQTGIYCVTFAENIYDDRSGELLGCFGIDFYMDKLVDILGSSYTDSSYAFLADAKGEIINHPYGKYQMSENGSVNVIELPYNSAEPDGKSVKLFKDYNGSFKIMTATRNKASGFTVYVVDSITSVYSGVFIYGSICITVLLACVIVVYKVMTRLITMQDETNAKLKESADAAIAADKAKSSFLAQMSHEIRTPINAVLGMNEMILHECGETNIREYSMNIQSSGRTLLSLINSILDFSKIEDGKMEIIPVEYDTAAMIGDLVNSISPRAADKGLEIFVDADKTLPCSLRGDDVRIRQVISNLLTNAVKYTEKGTVTLTLRKESADENSIVLYAEVSDTGIGIREEDIGALFESFKRLEEKRNRNIEGTGLGMSIVTRLLDLMGSKLEVRSVYGEGSSFSFRLRQEIVNAEQMGSWLSRSADETDKQLEDSYLYAPEAKVLVVDDNPMNLKVAASLLRLYGITADLADSGEKCLEMIQQKQYDVIFLDHMMPKMDGIEVIREIKKNELVPKKTSIIALTANAIVGAKEMYLAEGFAFYLTKPIESKALEKQLISCLPDNVKTFRTREKPGKPQEAPEADPDSMTMEDILKLREICPAVNAAEGLANCMDSKEFFFETLASFAETDKSEELDKALAAGDFDLYRITVHSVKSAARTIGADVLSEHARELEFAARDGDTEFVKTNHQSFADEYRTIIEQVRKAAGS